MSEPVNFGAYDQQLFFGFLESKYFTLVQLDPRIGSFELSSIESTHTHEDGLVATKKVVPIEELHDSKNEAARQLLSKNGGD